MALDTTAPGLSDEIKSAREHVDTFLGEDYRSMIERFHGPHYRRGKSDTYDFANHGHAWISLFLPALASGNPRIKAKTLRSGPIAAFVKAVELATNRNFELQTFKRVVEELAVHWAFKYSVSLTTPRPVPGLTEREDVTYRPTTFALSLEDFVWDPYAKRYSQARYQAHRIVRDRASALKEAREFPERGWNQTELLSLDGGLVDRHDKRREELRLTRDDVEFWEVWIPEETLDEATDENGRKFKPTAEEGYNGTIYTVSEGAGDFVRRPRPFWGPQDGPYNLSGHLFVPGELIPLSPIGATQVQAERLNAFLDATLEAIQGYARGWAIKGDDNTAKEVFKNFEDLGVFSLEGMGDDDIREMVQQVEKGGITQQHLLIIDFLRLALEQASGMTEAQRGQVSGDATATEASIAQQASGQRMSYMTEKFIHSAIKPIAKKEAWYLAMHPSSRTPLGDQAEGLFLDPVTMQPIEQPVFVGGLDSAPMVDELDIEVEPISMRFTTELLEAERAAQWDAWVLNTAQIRPMTPWVDWRGMDMKKAEQLRDPSLAKLIDNDKAMLAGQMQMMMTMGMGGAPQQGFMPQAQPRLGIDLQGQRPQLKASEKPGGFSANARPQPNKAPRAPGSSNETHAMTSKVNTP